MEGKNNIPVLLERLTIGGYKEGIYTVKSELNHLRRGYCCSNGCRHCPWPSSVLSQEVLDALLSMEDLEDILNTFPTPLKEEILLYKKNLSIRE